jgi:pyridinium-3,5-biscarboxylic acid mononucleotide sulfurtransferase
MIHAMATRMQDSIDSKHAALLRRLKGLDGAVVAYSGGVDSTFLMHATHEALSDRALAITADSPALARKDLESAASIARSRGWRHEVVDTNELQRDGYTRNASDRCYWCKSELFDVIQPIALSLGAEVLVGTNLDDLSDHRPGIKAGRERDVMTPLADAGLTKIDVRELSRRAGLPTADRPASPCLASRLAYGVRVTEEGLRRVEAAEELVRSLGFELFRVRDHGDTARIEVPEDEIEKAVAIRDRLVSGLKELGFVYVSIDLEGFRSGALNEVLKAPRLRTRREEWPSRLDHS